MSAQSAQRCEVCAKAKPSLGPQVQAAPHEDCTQPPAPLPGASLVGLLLEGRYRVGALLAVGGMGEVFTGTDVRLDRPVAIKFLARKHCADETLVSRFLVEAQSAAKLDHPNVVTVLSTGHEGARPFIVMRFVEGESLAHRLRTRGPLPWSEAVRVAMSVCDALSHIHAHGYVHRDIKPHNLMLTPDGRVIVLDFGILRVLGRGTDTVLVGGTPEYMAPEQGSDPSVADGRADLYALGATLFALVTGHPPFEAASPIDTMLRHKVDPPPSARARTPDVPPALDGVIVKALAKAPEARFDSPAAMKDALAALLETARVASPASRPRRVLGFVTAAVLGATACVAIASSGWRDERGASFAAPALANPVCPSPAPASIADTVTTPSPQLTATPGAAVAMAASTKAGAPPPLQWVAAARPSRPPVDEDVPSRAQTKRARGRERRAIARVVHDGPVANERTPIAAAAREPQAEKTTALAPPSNTAAATPPVPKSEAAPPKRTGPGQLRVIVHHAGQATWADIVIDDASAGQRTWVQRSLAPGPHRVRASRPGYRTAQAAITVLPGETHRVKLELDRE